eukprot:g40507.t1
MARNRANTKDLPKLWATHDAKFEPEPEGRNRVNTQDLGNYFSEASPAPVKKQDNQPRLKVESGNKQGSSKSKRKDCHVCKKACNLRCGACKKFWYCSVECQTKHWEESHMEECVDESAIQEE